MFVSFSMCVCLYVESKYTAMIPSKWGGSFRAQVGEPPKCLQERSTHLVPPASLHFLLPLAQASPCTLPLGLASRVGASPIVECTPFMVAALNTCLSSSAASVSSVLLGFHL